MYFSRDRPSPSLDVLDGMHPKEFARSDWCDDCYLRQFGEVHWPTLGVQVNLTTYTLRHYVESDGEPWWFIGQLLSIR